MKDPNRRRQRTGPGIVARGEEDGTETWKGKSSSSVFGSGSGGGRWRSLWCTLSVIVLCGAVPAIIFSAFRFFGVSFRPVLAATWQQSSALNAVSDFSAAGGGGGGSPLLLTTTANNNRHLIHHAVSFPDQLVIFLNYPSPTTAAADLHCLYFSPSANTPDLDFPPISVDPTDASASATSPSLTLLRCHLPPRGHSVSVGGQQHPPPVDDIFRWDWLAYAALLDRRDNSTIVFVKGLNLRPDRLSEASRYECVFGWHLHKPKYLLTADALSAAQEIVRCRTPLSVLRRYLTNPGQLGNAWTSPPLVSVNIKGRGGRVVPSLASPVPVDPPPQRPRHTMCVCTMVRNQARFLKEWIVYHSRVGVQRWFIYDNNSNDSLPEAVRSIDKEGYNVTRHAWPWIKTQEAGFAHCALRARSECQWVGFIDVDEFLFLPSSRSDPSHSLHEVLANHSTNFPDVGELRTSCHSFGPSGQRKAPAEGVTVGYTCRMAAPERHKSIVRPEALSPSLMNIIHHFHLRDRYQYVNMERSVMVINHYKYQAWEVFKEKFYRRVATYVADWQAEENVGSKDRAPGLGTKAVEPPDWPSRFCEVRDTGLRKWVLEDFADLDTGLLPWSL